MSPPRPAPPASGMRRPAAGGPAQRDKRKLGQSSPTARQRRDAQRYPRWTPRALSAVYDGTTEWSQAVTTDSPVRITAATTGSGAMVVPVQYAYTAGSPEARREGPDASAASGERQDAARGPVARPRSRAMMARREGARVSQVSTPAGQWIYAYSSGVLQQVQKSAGPVLAQVLARDAAGRPMDVQLSFGGADSAVV